MLKTTTLQTHKCTEICVFIPAGKKIAKKGKENISCVLSQVLPGGYPWSCLLSLVLSVVLSRGRGYQGISPRQDEGYPPARTGGGHRPPTRNWIPPTPPPLDITGPPTGQATPRTVRLLRSRRRTFLFSVWKGSVSINLYRNLGSRHYFKIYWR